MSDNWRPSNGEPAVDFSVACRKLTERIYARKPSGSSIQDGPAVPPSPLAPPEIPEQERLADGWNWNDPARQPLSRGKLDESFIDRFSA